MNVRTHLIIIKGKDQTDMVASFRFHDRICEVIYSSAPNKAYEFKSSNVEILPLQKKINPSEVIVTANGQNISGIDELLDFGAYYRIVRNGKKDLSFRRSEVQFQKNCLSHRKNQEVFQYFKDTAAAIGLVAENGINTPFANSYPPPQPPKAGAKSGCLLWEAAAWAIVYFMVSSPFS